MVGPARIGACGLPRLAAPGEGPRPRASAAVGPGRPHLSNPYGGHAMRKLTLAILAAAMIAFNALPAAAACTVYLGEGSSICRTCCTTSPSGDVSCTTTCF